MLSMPKLALLLASAALLVAAGPVADASTEPEASVVEAAPEQATTDLGYEGGDIDPSSVFDAFSVERADDPRLQARNGNLYCGGFAAADYGNAHTLVVNLSTNPGKTHVIPARGCKRVQCMNTSGVYVCNDRGTSMTLTQRQIAAHTETILVRCCLHDRNGNTIHQRMSGGQQFTDALGGGWNVIIGYANCGHPDTRIPSSYNGGTVNGIGCLPAQMWIG